MTEITEITLNEEEPNFGVGWGRYTAVIAAQNDTVELDNFNELIDAIVIDVSNLSTCTFTLATNVITVTQDITGQKVLILAVGT